MAEVDASGAIIVDYLNHKEDEVLGGWSEHGASVQGQSFVAQGSNLTSIEFEMSNTAWDYGYLDYRLVIIEFNTDAAGQFASFGDVVFTSDLLRTDTGPGPEGIHWQHVAVDVSGVDLEVGRGYAFLLDAVFDEEGDPSGWGGGMFLAANYGPASPWAGTWTNGEPTGSYFYCDRLPDAGYPDVTLDRFGLDMAYRMTYQDDPAPPAGRTINGTSKSDIILVGSDPLKNTGLGDDVVHAQRGSDTAHGGDGSDRLYGERGRDTLHGDGGNDFLYGGEGKDELIGGGGDDWLQGGDGRDRLTGGAGADTFFFEAADKKAHDTITDFDFASGDRIDLVGVTVTRHSLIDTNHDGAKDALSVTITGGAQILIEGVTAWNDSYFV